MPTIPIRDLSMVDIRKDFPKIISEVGEGLCRVRAWKRSDFAFWMVSYREQASRDLCLAHEVAVQEIESPRVAREHLMGLVLDIDRKLPIICRRGARYVVLVGKELLPVTSEKLFEVADLHEVEDEVRLTRIIRQFSRTGNTVVFTQVTMKAVIEKFHALHAQLIEPNLNATDFLVSAQNNGTFSVTFSDVSPDALLSLTQRIPEFVRDGIGVEIKSR